MTIWFANPTVESLNARIPNTLVEHIGIEFTEIGEDFIKARMPVDNRTVQPARILHGGASVALAETLGSIAAYHCIDPAQKIAVGLEINANHVRSVREGCVTGTVRPLHIGHSTQIWEIHIRDDQDRLVCISRITMAVLERAHRPNGSGSAP
jgi:1,4-dihydroxy-2-naphthoyl-CoA hydrolase